MFLPGRVVTISSYTGRMSPETGSGSIFTDQTLFFSGCLPP